VSTESQALALVAASIFLVLLSLVLDALTFNAQTLRLLGDSVGAARLAAASRRWHSRCAGEFETVRLRPAHFSRRDSVAPNGVVRSRGGDVPNRWQWKSGLRRLIDRVGGWFSANPESEAVTTRITLDASPETVWKALRFYEEVPQRPGLALLLFLPRPIRSEGEKTQVGARVRCQYEGGHLLKRINAAEPGHLLRFDVLEQHLGIENCVSMEGGSYEIRASDHRSEVLLTTRYRGHLRPRSLWRPFERLLAHRLHGHILEGMKTALRVSPPERATSEARNTGFLAPATGEPPSPGV
jgi:hypothetical protein